jgi:hypothetical protein
MLKRITKYLNKDVAQREMVGHQQDMQNLSNLIVSKEGGIVELERLINGGNDKNTKRSDGKN